MEVICIKSGQRIGLTLNKKYDVIDSFYASNKYFHRIDYYKIINDNGKLRNYYADKFITLVEFRNKRINEILEDE